MSRARFSADRDGYSDGGPLFPLSLPADAGILPQIRARQLPVTFCKIRRCGHSDICCLLTGFLLGSLLRPEDGIDIFIRYVVWLPSAETELLKIGESLHIASKSLRLGMFYVGSAGSLGPVCFSLLVIQKHFLRFAANHKLPVLNGTILGLFLETRVERNGKYIVTA